MVSGMGIVSGAPASPSPSPPRWSAAASKAAPEERFQQFVAVIQRCRNALRRAEQRASRLEKQRVAALTAHFEAAPKAYQGLMDVYRPDCHYRLPAVWRFRIDPTATGEKQGWHQAGLDDSGWAQIATYQSWEYQGYGGEHPQAKSPQNGYDGLAWYRCRFTVEPRRAQSRVWLQLGPVSDDCWVYLNGQEVGSHDSPEQTTAEHLTQARRYDVTAQLSRDQANCLVVKVLDRGGWGGMCRPAFLIFGQTQ